MHDRTPSQNKELQRGKRSLGRHVTKTHDQEHKTEQKDSRKTRPNVVKYLTREIIEELHQAIVLETHNVIAERSHILNPSTLEMALELPRKYLYGRELYPDLFEKAAVLMRELIRGHAFEAANKRTGYMAALTFLDENGYALSSSVNEAIELTTKLALDQMSVSDIADWLRKHSRKPD